MLSCFAFCVFLQYHLTVNLTSISVHFREEDLLIKYLIPFSYIRTSVEHGLPLTVCVYRLLNTKLPSPPLGLQVVRVVQMQI